MSLIEIAIEIDSELFEQFKEICIREGTTPEQVIISFIEFAANENNKDKLINFLLEK